MAKRDRRQPKREMIPMPSAGIGHNNPPPEMRLAVIGSRTFANFRLLTKILDEYLGTVVEVISGGADGADSLGARWGRKNGFEPNVFHPDHKNFKHPYHHRNRLIAERCTVLIAFWDGRSTGTKYTIEYARRIGREVRIVRF
jgi:predicted Rossmann fold nucleotide-binding protein DprA/Smf involved in DNA uptake